MNWREFEAAAPTLAHATKTRLEATRLALLGTIRADGSPRISPIEPYFTASELLLGAMTRSLKVRDLERNPRCVIHSPISHPDAGEPEFKLYGTLVEASDRDARSDAWWMSRPTEAAIVFAFRIDEAASVAWDLEQGEMTVTRWSRRSGLVEARRSYP
jgi:pyridoxamine 5'-phosphate oxidase-like protein